jgi:uncharacterized flavoprotein (TIGR03862 family)
MAAHVAASGGAHVSVFEKRKSPGRKLLIAGSSGLNISYDCDPGELHQFYRGPAPFFKNLFRTFSREDWLKFVNDLGLETFKGTSRRYFVREMKAAGLLRAWTDKLKSMGVAFEFGKEAVDFNSSGKIVLHLKSESSIEEREFDAVGFFLGGGSWKPEENPLRWPAFFRRAGLKFVPFASSNTGFEVDWPAALLKEAEGLPLKTVELKTSLGTRKGELVITEYGLEGTPVYALGKAEVVHLDLKPDLGTTEIVQKLMSATRENLAPMRRIKKHLNLCAGSEALLFHLSKPDQRSDLEKLVMLLKNFPLTLKSPRPLAEAISSSGGLDLEEIDSSMMLKKFPRVFVGGEMLNWDAPTGGFLIQACVSQGYVAGRGLLQQFPA